MSSAIIGEAILNEDPKVAVDDFIQCLRHFRFSSYVLGMTVIMALCLGYSLLRDADSPLSSLVASTALLFYDWFLTSSEEYDFLWRRRRMTYVRALFTLARYPALGGAVTYLIPLSKKLNNLTLCLCAVTIISSELIFVMRTWAIWEKSRGMLVFLVFLTIGCAVPVVAAGMRPMVMDIVIPFATMSDVQRCQTSVVEHQSQASFVPLFIMMVYEAVVLALTLYKILQIRKEIPRQSRSRLLNMLWVDGVIYFILMLLLHILALSLAMIVSDTRVWVGAAQLATVFHSVLSTRIMLQTARVWRQDAAGSQSRYRTTDPVEVIEFADLSDETTINWSTQG